jgi:hypothetical protein
MKYIKKLEEKKPKGAPDWHDSDAPDANGRFRDLSPKKLAAWLIKTRNKDVKRISGSLTQQVVFNRGDDPEYAKKMERTRKEVYKQLGRQDLLDAMDEAVNQFFYDDFKKWAWKLRAKINRMDYEDQVEFLSDEYMKKHGKWHRDENPDYIGAELVDLLQGDKVIKESEASDEMAYGQLEKIIDYAKMIRQRLENGEELDDWMYGKIIKSEDYLNTLADVIDGDDGVIEKDDRDWNDKRKGPHPYTASLSDEDEEDKEKQMKKQAEMDDDDPDAYKEMPGDKKARQKGKVKTSKHVKRYHDLYSESIKEAKGLPSHARNLSRKLKTHWLPDTDNKDIYFLADTNKGQTITIDLSVRTGEYKVIDKKDNVIYQGGDPYAAAKLIESAITERFNESSFSFGKKKQFGYEDINVAYGFWGTVEMNYDEEQTSIVWEDAFEMLTGYYKFSDDAALYYLNSKAGRHLADKFSGGEFYNMEDTMEDYAKDGQWKKWAKEYEKYAKEEMTESLSHVKIYEEYITERAAAAKRLFKDVVKGNTSSIEGQKISKEMAQAALDWFDRSMYARKYSNQVQGASMGAIAPLIFSDSWGIKKRISSKLKDEFKNLQDYYKRTLGESFEKANKLADDMFGEFGVANLSSKEMKEIIDMKKADKIAKKKYGEFGFATLAEEEMEEVLDDNPELVKEAFIGPFVFNDRMSDDELKAMYNGALDGYANYSKGFQHSKSDYKKAYHEIEKILKKRGVSVDETVVIEEKAEGARGPISDSGIETGLKNKAEETGVPIGLIRIIMRRGMAAWKTGHRPGATQQQWGYARVNSFLTKQPGTWGGADKDVAKEVRDGGHDSGLKK